MLKEFSIDFLLLSFAICIAILVVYDYIRIFKILVRIEEEIELIEEKIKKARVDMGMELNEIKEKLRMLQWLRLENTSKLTDAGSQ